MNGKWWYFLAIPFMFLITQSPKIGTLPEVRDAVDPNAQSGEYYVLED